MKGTEGEVVIKLRKPVRVSEIIFHNPVLSALPSVATTVGDFEIHVHP
jgi:hypothetical protein